MEATPEQAAEGLAICKVLANVLDRLVQANCHLARSDPGQVTRFHAMKAPGIAVQQYLERIHKYASCSNECFVLALIYIDRLIQRSNFLLTDLNVHRVVITAVLLAAKFFDDAYYNNAYYAKVGGVLVSEMNGLEVDFLFRINFSLHVAPDVFAKYRGELMVHSSMVVNNNCSLSNSMMTMPTVLDTQVYSPQPVPILSDPCRMQQQQQYHHGPGTAVQHQVTPSPPTPPEYMHHLSPDYAIINPYEMLHHVTSAPTLQQQQQQYGFQSIDYQHQQQSQHDPYAPLDVQNLSSYYPQHFADNPYYVPPMSTTTNVIHYDGVTATTQGPPDGWSYARLGVSNTAGV